MTRAAGGKHSCFTAFHCSINVLLRQLRAFRQAKFEVGVGILVLPVVRTVSEKSEMVLRFCFLDCRCCLSARIRVSYLPLCGHQRRLEVWFSRHLHSA